MPTTCDRCGKASYVTYVKVNPGNICDDCEDLERRRNGRPDDWSLIKNYNARHQHHPLRGTGIKGFILEIVSKACQ